MKKKDLILGRFCFLLVLLLSLATLEVQPTCAASIPLIKAVHKVRKRPLLVESSLQNSDKNSAWQSQAESEVVKLVKESELEPPLIRAIRLPRKNVQVSDSLVTESSSDGQERSIYVPRIKRIGKRMKRLVLQQNTRPPSSSLGLVLREISHKKSRQQEEIVFYFDTFVMPIVEAEKNGKLQIFCHFVAVSPGDDIRAVTLLDRSQYIESIYSPLQYSSEQFETIITFNPNYIYSVKQFADRESNTFSLIVTGEKNHQ